MNNNDDTTILTMILLSTIRDMRKVIHPSNLPDCTISTAHDLVRMAIVAETLLVISELWLK